MKMNRFICFINLLLISISAQAQLTAPLTVSGNIKNYKAPSTIFLSHRVGDSLYRTMGKFDANGNFNIKTITDNGMAKATLLINEFDLPILKYLDSAAMLNPQKLGEIVLDMKIEPGHLKVNSPKDMATAKVTGLKWGDEVKRGLGSLYIENEDLRRNYDKESNKDIKAKLGSDYEIFYKDKFIPGVLKFAAAHTQSQVGLDALNLIIYREEDVINKALALLDKFPKKLQENFVGVQIRKKINSAIAAREIGKNRTENTKSGVVVKDFGMNDINGKLVKVSDFRGKYLLIDFWASWCGPCRKENPNVVKAYEEFKDKNFTILGVSLDNSKAKWLEAIKKDELPWTQISDLKGWDTPVTKLFGLIGIPFNMLVDPEGKILATNLRGEQLSKKLSEILK